MARRRRRGNFGAEIAVALDAFTGSRPLPRSDILGSRGRPVVVPLRARCV